MHRKEYNMADTNTRTHHELSFSKWPMWNACPCFDSDGDTAATVAGTAQHLDFEESINEVNTGVPALHSTPGAAWAAGVASELAGSEHINSETRVEVLDTGVPYLRGIFGFCDAHFVSGGHLTVIDYKSGGKTELDYMPQLAGYAFALLSSAKGLFITDDVVTCVILYGATREVVKRDFTSDELAEIAKRIVSSRLADDRIPRCGAACRYCSHRLECTAIGGKLAAFRRGELAEMSDAKLYATLSAMKAAIEAEMERLKGVAAANGGALDDGEVRYEIHTSRGRAKANDIVGMWQSLCDRDVLIEQADIMKACTISKAAFVDMAKAEARAKGVKVKELGEIYERNTLYGDDIAKLVRVEATNAGN